MIERYIELKKIDHLTMIGYYKIDSIETFKNVIVSCIESKDPNIYLNFKFVFNLDNNDIDVSIKFCYHPFYDTFKFSINDDIEEFVNSYSDFVTRIDEIFFEYEKRV